MSVIVDLFRDDAKISFEGDFRIDQSGLVAIQVEPTEILHRHTIVTHGDNATLPTNQFLVIPLLSENIKIIHQRILPQIGLHKNVWHIQIEQAGNLGFASYDSFSDGCAIASPVISQEQLQTLQKQNIIKSFKLVT